MFHVPLGTFSCPLESKLIFKMLTISVFSNYCLLSLSLPQLGGSFLLGVGVWVLVDPTGFREIVAANPLLFTGVYIILGMGGMLFLLGFLGCCGAIRENKCLLLFVSRLHIENVVMLLILLVCMCVDYSLCRFLGLFMLETERLNSKNALQFAIKPQASCIVNAE